MKTYILITPARDEEAYIEKTIHSVISQTVLPKKWVIVSDCSVDRTDEIVRRFTDKYDFITLLRRSNTEGRNFGSKALAFRYGYDHVKEFDFDLVGNLDADVSFDPLYYEGVSLKFEENEYLGLAGGIRFDLRGGQFRQVHCARNSVGGPFQLFRRQCYEEIGGYQPLRSGGIDCVAETMARMHGWEVESFPQFKVFHHRCTGTSGSSIFKAMFKAGVKDYLLGYHPLFETARFALRLFSYPLLVGSAITLLGYFWGSLKDEKLMPDDFVAYIRAEQLTRLRSVLRQHSL